MLTAGVVGMRSSDIDVIIGRGARDTLAPEGRVVLRPAASSASDLSAIINSFPKTRYYGSKRKLLPWINACIEGLDFDTALDAFGGTGSVSLLLKAMGKDVTYHDGLKFNEDVARTLLSNTIALSRADVISFIRDVELVPGVVSEEFAGMFYTKRENEWLDGFALRLNRAKISRSGKALLRYLLYQACLKKRPFNVFHRANLHLRTKRNVTRSFGNYATWGRTFRHHMLEAYDELCGIKVPHGICRVLPSGNAANIRPGYDLVYLDPPYLSLEQRYNRDDYWRRYHFLEGLSDYDCWRSRIDPNSSIGMLRQAKWMQSWSNKAKYLQLLCSVIEAHKKSIVVLSYVANAYPDERQIKRYFDQTFKKVTVSSREHSHALGDVPRRELLFIGRS